MNIKNIIEEKLEQIEELQKEIEALRKCDIYIKDLEIYEDRWNRVRLMSKNVNKIADKVEFTYSCGCCSDASIYAWPYVEVEDLKVFSSPPYITIGEKNPYEDLDCVMPYWKENLEQNNISYKVIEQVKQYLIKNTDLEE